MSLLSLSVESTAHRSFPTDSSRLGIQSSLSCSHPESRRLELFRFKGSSSVPRRRSGIRGRNCADLVARRSSTLCNVKWEKFEDVPGRKLEDVASGCFLSDFERRMESIGNADFTFSRFGRNRGASHVPLQVHSEASRYSAFQSKVDDSVAYSQLRESNGCPVGPGHPTAVGSLYFERGSDSLTHISMETDRPTREKSADFIEEDVKVRPKSLKLLKRKQSITYEAYCRKRQALGAVDASGFPQVQNPEGFKERLAGVGDSFKSAFSSSMFIIKTLQSHFLGLRKHLFREDLHGVLRSMHADLQDSFLWLFQQVFSCTPKLMLLTMVLLADFTVHSMSKHVALAEPPATSVSISSVDGFDISKAVECLSLEDPSVGDVFIRLRDRDSESRIASDAGKGNVGGRSLHIGGGTAGQPLPGVATERRATRPEDDTCGGEASISSQDCNHHAQGASLLGEGPSIGNKRCTVVSESLDLRLDKSCQTNVLDQETKRMLVAPVNAELQSDNYTCYDRTDLAYQQAISLDPGNPLLLANYAQFLYLVRHDHKRAEGLFQRAMKADPVDGDVMGRFASFLWIAKGDLAEADKAYRAAVAADPTSSFHAGCYAHFLWNAGED